MTGPDANAIRVLHVVGGMNRGGVEAWLMDLLRHRSCAEYRFDFLTHAIGPTAYDGDILTMGSQIYPCLTPNRPLAYAQNFRRIVRTHGPFDVIHSHTYLFSGYVLWLAMCCDIPIRIAHIYPQVDHRRATWLRAIVRFMASRLIEKCATQVLATSRMSLKAFQAHCRCAGLKPSVVYPFPNLTPFFREIDREGARERFGFPTDKVIVTYVARFTGHKNHRQIIRLANRLRHLPLHFVLAGSHGECQKEVQQAAERSPNIQMVLSLPDISELLLASDAFFCPTLNEGFGRVVVEASAAGLIVVSSDLPTLREACPPVFHPLMFPPDNDDEASQRLAVLASHFIHRTGDLDSMVAQAKQQVRSMSIESSWPQLARCYRPNQPRE